MIAYPGFKRPQPKDRLFIDNFTKQFAPYSDFNFENLWSYEFLIKKFKKNLAVIFEDDTINNTFLGLLGNNKIDEAIRELLKESVANGLKPILKLIPESVVKNIARKDNFLIEEDRDNFDYVYSVDELINLDGETHKELKRKVVKFQNRYSADMQYCHLNLTPQNKKEIVKVFEIWIKNKDDPQKRQEELIFLNKYLKLNRRPAFLGAGVRFKGHLAAFVLSELTYNFFCVSNFMYFDNQFPGLTVFMLHNLCKDLKRKSIEFLNLEQDLGNKGLRTFKLRLKPSFFLKKYKIMAI